MNGKECLIEIKKLSFLRSVPVIIYSTSSLQDDVIQTRKLGAADFITKPPSIPVLSSKLLSSIRALERRVPVEATLPKI
jgi:DNA-binding response OmpR family regulator